MNEVGLGSSLIEFLECGHPLLGSGQVRRCWNNILHALWRKKNQAGEVEVAGVLKFS